MGQAYSNYINGGGGSADGNSNSGGGVNVQKQDGDEQKAEVTRANYNAQTPNLQTANEQGKGAFDTSMNRYDFMGGLQNPHF